MTESILWLSFYFHWPGGERMKVFLSFPNSYSVQLPSEIRMNSLEGRTTSSSRCKKDFLSECTEMFRQSPQIEVRMADWIRLLQDLLFTSAGLVYSYWCLILLHALTGLDLLHVDVQHQFSYGRPTDWSTFLFLHLTLLDSNLLM